MASVSPADTLLMIDIGNTRIGMAMWNEDGLREPRHVSRREPGTWDEALAATWNGGAAHERSNVIIGSVSPDTTAEVQEHVQRVCGRRGVLVRDDVPLPMPMDIDNPREIGVDRVCAAAAAYERVKAACAVASFGTATTIDCVSAEGRFLGGTILPGFDMWLDALPRGTAQLPRAELAPPVRPFGKDTHEAIANGVAFGMVGALREIVERFATALGEWPQLVVTGGNAELVSKMADFVDAVVPHLTLMGLALAYRKAAGQA